MAEFSWTESVILKFYCSVKKWNKIKKMIKTNSHPRMNVNIKFLFFFIVY